MMSVAELAAQQAASEASRRLGSVSHCSEIDALEAFAGEFSAMLEGWEMRISELRQEAEDEGL